MNRKKEKLIKDIIDDIIIIREKKGIDILKMPDQELEKWIKFLVKLNSK